MTENRQTTRYLQQRFEEAGIRPVTRRGQNFLVDLNLLDLLVREADIQPTDVVMEVGTGTGSLTMRLAELAAAVLTVELDPLLFQLASEALQGRENVTMIQQDVLRNKNHIHAHVMNSIQQLVATHTNGRFKLVANLPFNIATPLISNLLLTPIVPSSMTVTIQKELGDRITAKPGSKDYGALSVWMQSLCATKLVRVLPPQVFWPQPKVHSAILQIEPSDTLRSRFPDLGFYHTFVRSLFFHRRKYLRTVLISAFKKPLSKTDVDDVLVRQEIVGQWRAEQLDIARIMELAEAFRQKLLELKSSD